MNYTILKFGIMVVYKVWYDEQQTLQPLSVNMMLKEVRGYTRIHILEMDYILQMTCQNNVSRILKPG